LANLIPYLGPLAGALTAMLVCISNGSMKTALYSLLAFLLVKLVDDAFVQPLVVGRSVRMHPLLVLFVIIIGGKYFGILGMLLAVPITGFLKVALAEVALYFRKCRFI